MSVANKDTKAQKRFVDQPGQWVNETPKAVRDRQKKDWDKFFAGQKKQTSKKK